MRKANPGKAWMGELTAEVSDNKAVVTGNTLIGTPVYKAGLDAGDILQSIDGKPVDASKPIPAYFPDKKPGDKIVISYQNRTGSHQAILTLEENPELEVVPVEKAGQTLTKEQETFRSAWLSSKVK
jgi:S1-C subfamily serine protease